MYDYITTTSVAGILALEQDLLYQAQDTRVSSAIPSIPFQATGKRVGQDGVKFDCEVANKHHHEHLSTIYLSMPQEIAHSKADGHVYAIRGPQAPKCWMSLG